MSLEAGGENQDDERFLWKGSWDFEKVNAADPTPPSFFLAGAPKCGTTALYRYLREHPAVFMPDLKEPHFFSTDLPGLREVTDWSRYLSLFREAGQGTVSGEASASYLMSEEAIGSILGIWPTARFIVILRNPIEMAPALHAELLYNLSEDIGDFPQAWDLQEERSVGRHIPPGAKESRILQYRTVCAIGDQMERFRATVPEGQRLILLFDDFKADPDSVYREVLKHLGLPSDHRSEFPRENPNKVLRSRRLATFHKSLPKRLGRLYHPLKSAGNVLGISPTRILDRANVARAPRRPLDPEFRARLEEEFRPQIRKVSAMLGRDLTRWFEHDSSPQIAPS